MNKTKMVSALAVVLALALVTGCASSGPSKKEQLEEHRQWQEEERQKQEAEQAKLAEEAAKAKPLGFWDTVPYDSRWYSIQPPENNTVTVYTSGVQIMSLKAYDSNMKLIAENTGSSSDKQDERNARLKFPVEAGKVYFFNVRGLPSIVQPWESSIKSNITAELEPAGTLTDGGSVVIKEVTISYSDGLLNGVNNSGKAARVRYKHEDVEVSADAATTTRTAGVTTRTRTVKSGGQLMFSSSAGSKSETRISWENPPKEITILYVTLIEPTE